MTTVTDFPLSGEPATSGHGLLTDAAPQSGTVVFNSGSTTLPDLDDTQQSVKLGTARKGDRNILRSHSTRRTKRRLRGFLIELQNPESKNSQARVAFVEDGEMILYDLPAEQLVRAEITEPNQPFQMDEVEIEEEDGAIVFGYRFKALAKPSEAYMETLQIDEERKQKRDLIFREFANSQD